MAVLPEKRIITVRVKEGSALERMITSSPAKTVAAALHEMAAVHEVLKPATASQP